VACTPGSRFSYSDAGYSIVEQLIEDVTGEPFAMAMERLVLRPLGLDRTFFRYDLSGYEATMGHDRHGHVVEGGHARYPNLSGAGLWTTPSELALLTIELIQASQGNSSSFFSPEMARTMLDGSGCESFVGMGVFLEQNEGHTSFISKGWGVGYQCMLAAYPHLRGGVVVMTNSEPGKPQEKALVGEVIRDICKKYNWPGI
jgi:CubicO group peptidase (beta-lactamase class C family)